jgi:hypothetical protein
MMRQKSAQSIRVIKAMMMSAHARSWTPKINLE